MQITTFTQRLDTNSKHYIENTLEPKISALSKKAAFSRTLFFTLRAIAILSSVLLPILISINDKNGSLKTVSIILSICVAVTLGLEEAFRFKERYIKLEGLCNLLDNLSAEFAAEEGEFANLTDEKKYKKYISLCGKLMSASQQSLLQVFQELQPPTANNKMS